MNQLAFVITLSCIVLSVSSNAKEIPKGTAKSKAELALLLAEAQAKKGADMHKNKVVVGHKGANGKCETNIASPHDNQVQINTDINVVAQNIVVICQN